MNRQKKLVLTSFLGIALLYGIISWPIRSAHTQSRQFRMLINSSARIRIEPRTILLFETGEQKQMQDFDSARELKPVVVTNPAAIRALERALIPVSSFSSNPVRYSNQLGFSYSDEIPTKGKLDFLFYSEADGTLTASIALFTTPFPVATENTGNTLCVVSTKGSKQKSFGYCIGLSPEFWHLWNVQ